MSTIGQDGQAQPECDVAVVFVHGIGAQASGTTLLAWAEPLLEVLSQAGPAHGLTTEVICAEDLHGDHAELVFELTRDGGRRATWLLTEARWAEDFHPSTASEVLTWAVKFTGRAARRGLAALAQQLSFVIIRKILPLVRKAFPWESGCIGAMASILVWTVMLFLYGLVLYILIGPYVLLAFALLVVAPALVALGAAALVALLVLQRVPIIGARVKPIVTGLVTSIGDAQAYRDRAIQAAAMRQRLLKRLAHARSRAKRVVVVAHSQGAAISCRALLRGAAPWPDQLVTVGAGTGLLNSEQSIAQWRALGGPPWINIWTPLDPVPAGPIGDNSEQVHDRRLETLWHDVADGGFHAGTADGRLWLRWTPGAGPQCWAGSDDLAEQARTSSGQVFDHAAVAIPTGAIVTKPLERREATLIAAALLGFPRGEKLTWTDTVMPREFTTPGPQEWPVTNRHSLLQDHTTYAQNLTQVQQPLARLLLNLADATAEALPAIPTRVENAHVVRVRALAMSRLISAVTAVITVLFLAERQIDTPVLAVVNWASERWKQAHWALDTFGSNVARIAVLAAFGVAVYAVVASLMASAWRSWHRAESLRLCTTAHASRLRAGVAGTIFLLLYALALTLTVAWLWWRYPTFSLASAPLFLLLLFGYPLWALIWPFVGLRPRRLPARP